MKKYFSNFFVGVLEAAIFFGLNAVWAYAVILPPAPVQPPPPETHTSGDGSYRGERVRLYAPGSTGKVRATPAGTTLGTQPHGAMGTIVDGAVFGSDSLWGYGWWKVNFDTGLDGWVAGTHNTGNTSLFLLQKLDGTFLRHPTGEAASVHCPYGVIPLTGDLGDEFGNKGLRGQQLGYKESRCYSIRVTEPKDFLVVGTDNELAVGVRVIGEMKGELSMPSPSAVRTDGEVVSESSFGVFNGGEIVVRSASGGKVPAGEYILRVERKATQEWIERQCATTPPNPFFCQGKAKLSVYWRQEDKATSANFTCPAGSEEFHWWINGGGICRGTREQCPNHPYYGRGKAGAGDDGIKLPFGETQHYCAKNYTENASFVEFVTAAYNNYECNNVKLKITPPRGSGIARIIDVNNQPQTRHNPFDGSLARGVWLFDLSASNDSQIASPDCVATYAVHTDLSGSGASIVPPPPPTPLPPPPAPVPPPPPPAVVVPNPFAMGDRVQVIPTPAGERELYARTPEPCSEAGRMTKIAGAHGTIARAEAKKCGAGFASEWARVYVNFDDGTEGWVVAWRLRRDTIENSTPLFISPKNINCVASPATATVGTSVTFTSTIGTPYVWIAAGGDPKSGTDATFTTRFLQAGNQSVVGYKYDGTVALCNVVITGVLER